MRRCRCGEGARIWKDCNLIHGTGSDYGKLRVVCRMFGARMGFYGSDVVWGNAARG